MRTSRETEPRIRPKHDECQLSPVLDGFFTAWRMGSKRKMHGYPIHWLARLLLGAALGIASFATFADDEIPPTIPEAPSLPNPDAFDALFKRLEFGDLTALDTKQQQKVAEQLQKLLPPGDAHRQRLLDSMHCGLNFNNKNKEGYAYADARLAEALKASDAAAAIRFYYCRGGFQASLSTERDALADTERGIDMARSIDDDLLVAAGLEGRGSVYSFLGIHGKALADLLEAQRIYQQHELNEVASQALLSIGIAFRRLGYIDRAREYLNQSVEHAQRVAITSPAEQYDATGFHRSGSRPLRFCAQYAAPRTRTGNPDR